MRKQLAIFLGGMMMFGSLNAALKNGDKVADFSAPLSDGTTFHLFDWVSKGPLVLYFYPKNDTPGCTTEACGLRDDINAFRGLKASVVGVSYDSIESHKKFIAKYHLPFPLISDQGKAVSKAFGVSGMLFPRRATFIIGKGGTILFANPSVNPKTHSQEIQEALAKIKTSE